MSRKEFARQLDHHRHQVISGTYDQRRFHCRDGLECIDMIPIAAEKIAVNLLIAAFKENRFPTVTTLRHVMPETGYRHAGQTRHERKLTMDQDREK
jgi:hypothetical protein